MVKRALTNLAMANGGIRQIPIILCCLLTSVTFARAEVVTGTYDGNGAAPRTVGGVGFRPDVVIIKGDNSQSAVIRTSAMPTDRTKQLAQDEPLLSNRILDFTADGFVVGSDADVNTGGVQYAWVAFSNDPGSMAVGSYLGIGLSSRDVTGLGFAPAVVFVIGDNNHRPHWKSLAMPAGESMAFDDEGLRGGLITDLLTDGFHVGTDSSVNGLFTTYFYVAWGESPGSLAVGTYVGNGANKQDVHGMGFTPEWALVKAGEGLPAVQKPKALGGDKSGFVTPEAFSNNALMKVEGDGIEVGNDYRVNEQGRTYYYLAIEDNHTHLCDLQVGLAADDSTPAVGESVTFTVDLLNDGPDDATGVALTVVLPTGLSYVSSAPAVGTYDDVTGIWTVGDLHKHVATELAVTALVGAGAAGQSLTATAGVSALVESDTDGSNNMAGANVIVPGADLAVTLVVDNPTPNEGEQVHYTATVSNIGPDATTGVALTMTWPAGLSFNSAAASVGHYSSVTGIWTLGDLAVGGTETLVITGRAGNGTAGQTLTTAVAVTASDLGDPVNANDAASVDVIVNATSSDLGMLLAADDPQPDVGQTVTFTATLTNGGPDDDSGVVASFTLPAGLTYASHSVGAGAFDPGTGTWTVGGLVAGDAVTLLVDATVDAGTGGSTLTATVAVAAADQPDPQAANDTASTSITVTSADLAITLGVDTPSPNPGDPVTFTVTLHNNGPSAATSVAAVVALPPELTFVSSTPEAGAFDSGTGTWSLPAIPAHGTTTLQIATSADGMVGGENLTTTATITGADQSDPVTANNTVSLVIGVTSADLGLAIAFDDTTPDVGQTILATITLANAGPDDVTGAEVAMALPPGLTLAGNNVSAGSYDQATGSWHVGDLAAGAGATLDLTLVVDGDTAGATLGISANVSSADQGDPAAANNAVSGSVVVTDSDLAVSFTVDDAHPDEGNHVVGRVVVTNLGPDLATGVTLDVPMPAGLVFDSYLADDGTFGADTGVWAPGAIATGDSTWLAVTAAVDTATAGTTLTWAAAVSGATQGDSEAANDTASVEITVTAVDLAVGLGVSDETPDEGQTVTFTVNVANNGPDPASGVSLDVTIPAGLTITNHSAGAGIFDELTGHWNVGGIGAQTGQLLQLTAAVDAGTAGDTLMVAAAVAGVQQADLVADNDTASVSLVVNAADLGIALGFSDSTPVEGQTITAAVVVSNAGPQPAMGIGALVGLPTGLTYASHSVINGAFDPDTGLWNLPALPVGGSAALLLTVTVDAGTADTQLISTAQITASSQGDPVPGNNAVATPITVANPQAVQAEIRPFSQTRRRLLPGGAVDDVLRLDLINPSTQALPLTSVTFTNPVTGAANQTVQDAAWSGLVLFHREAQIAAPVIMGEEPAAAQSFVNGTTTFAGLDLNIAAGDTLHLILRGAASLGAPDALELRPEVQDGDAFTFSRDIAVEGSWPLTANGELAVDGMTRAQITVHEVASTVLQLGSINNESMDVTIPGNGGEADQLTRINVENLGTAGLITAARALADDGDGVVGAGDAPIADLIWTGARWEATGLAWPVPATGLRILVTVDIAGDATGGTVRLSLPAGDDTGIGMASGNDGPIDEPVISSNQTVSTVDHVVVSTEAIASQVLAPGQSAVPLMHLWATNLYSGVDQELRGLIVHSDVRGQSGANQAQLDSVLAQLNLRRDGNGDGVLGSLGDDPIIAQATFSNGVATFQGIGWSIPADGERHHLFLTGAVSLHRAADGDTIAVSVAQGGDLVFVRPAALVGSWPLDSGARHRVDGMVARQIGTTDVQPVTLTADDGPVAALDVVIPSNGYASDTLTQLNLVNRGSATTADIAALQLWVDDGDGVFLPGSDAMVATMAGVDSTWVAPNLALAVPASGLHLFAGLTVTSAPSDSATVRLRIPVNGVSMASANDGPRDAAVLSNTTLLISTAPLLANLQVAPARSTVGQTITVTMNVTNISGEDVAGITPSGLAISGDGSANLMSGPQPASLDLVAGDSGSFVWTYASMVTGATYVTGRCEGTGAGGQMRRSLATTSGAHLILNPVGGLDVYPVANMPNSINRGQTGVVPLTLTLVNAGDETTADLRLDRLVITLDDGSGNPVVPNDLLSRATVNEGVNVYCDDTTLETSGQTVTLDLDPQVIVTSREPVTLGLRLDIRTNPSVSAFRVILAAPTDFTAHDNVNDAILGVALHNGSFPFPSGVGHLVAQATGLTVMRPDQVPRTAGVGQSGVELLRLELLGGGDPDLPSDVQISAFTVSLTDTLGHRLADASAHLRRLDVVGPLAVHAQAMLTDAGDSVVTFQLVPAISVPVGDVAVPVTIMGLTADDATLGPIRLRLDDAALFAAHDGNVGAAVPVTYQPAVISGPDVTIQAPVVTVSVSATPQLPAYLTPGARGVPTLTAHVSHTGNAGVGAAGLDTLRLVCLDDHRQALDPAALCDRLRVSWRGTPCADLSPPSASNGLVRVPLSGVLIAAGETGDLEITLDLETNVPAAGFEIVLPDSGLVGHDTNLVTPVTMRPAAGTAPPYSSGLAHIVSAAEELIVGFTDQMPPLVAGDGNAVTIGALTLTNTAVAGSGSLVLAGLTLRGADDAGLIRVLGGACVEFSAGDAAEPWAVVSDVALTDSTVVLTGATPLEIPAATTITLPLRARFRDGTQGGLRLGFAEGDVEATQPNDGAGTVRVRPAPGTAFPFWTEAGHFSDLSLEASYINFPNPFAAGREATAFAFMLAHPADVSLRIYSARGDGVVTLLNSVALPAGLHQDIAWDGRNGQGQTVRNGVYLAELNVRYGDGGHDRLLRKVAVVR